MELFAQVPMDFFEIVLFTHRPTKKQNSVLFDERSFWTFHFFKAMNIDEDMKL